MAKEITMTVLLQCTNGTFVLPTLGVNRLQLDQTTPGGGIPGMVNLTTTEVDIDLSALTSPGILFIRNTAAVGSGKNVLFGPKSGGSMIPFGMVLPGEVGTFRIDPSATLRMKQSGAGTIKAQLAVLDS